MWSKRWCGKQSEPQATDVMNSFGEVNALLTAPSVAAAMAKARVTSSDFTPAKEVQVRQLCHRVMNVYMQGETSFRNGHLDEYPSTSDWEIFRGVRTALNSVAANSDG